MTDLSMYVNPAYRAIRGSAYYTPKDSPAKGSPKTDVSATDLAAHLTATVVYSLSGATVFLLATFIRSI